ncbi:MAG: Glycogen synthase [Alphaproteobacteria bacterium ADurb.Bin438]|nr:MAG: Glycogen synthase [Alphaproteobacteria bacterium ADurb.Bin438]
MPLYASVNREKYGLKKLFEFSCVQMGNCEEFYSVYHTSEPLGVDVYFIEFNKYFNRKGFYHDEGGEYKDNAFRFAFLSKAAMQLAKDLEFKPDIIHVQDWQTCFVPYYVKTSKDEFFKDTKTVLTIHNIGYQGIFEPDVLDYAGIALSDFNSNGFESYGKTNLIKAGIVYADKVNTVSPNYANEILGPVGSNGMDWYLNQKKNDVSGIINGIDTDYWNPSKDKSLPMNYDVNNFKEGKAKCKKEIQKRLFLEEKENVPLIAFIARFADQKGIHMLAECIENVINTMDCQFAIIGSGVKWAEDFFGGLRFKYPYRYGAHIGYQEEMAHLLEAGADIFLMPSIYEPCGLNQMYSQVYGTLPVVRATGGLEDTVINYNEQEGSGTGFKFNDISAKALYNTIGWAVSTYYDRRDHFDNMIKQAMSLDYSWKSSTEKYLQLYNQALDKK